MIAIAIDQEQMTILRAALIDISRIAAFDPVRLEIAGSGIG